MSTNKERETHKTMVGSGWHPILDWAFAELDRIASLDIIEPDGRISRMPAWNIGQVKEKFGVLRLYCDFSIKLPSETTAKGYDVVRIAEERSEVTCEYCGAPGELRHSGWSKTLCDSCHQEHLAARREHEKRVKKIMAQHKRAEHQEKPNRSV